MLNFIKDMIVDFISEDAPPEISRNTSGDNRNKISGNNGSKVRNDHPSELQNLLLSLGNDIINNDQYDLEAKCINLIGTAREGHTEVSYIRNLEYRAVNYTERLFSFIDVIKQLAIASSTEIKHNPDKLINKAIGDARQHLTPHMKYLTSDCQGCSSHEFHNRYSGLREQRNFGNLESYVFDLEVMTTLSFISCEIFESIITALYTNKESITLPKNLTESNAGDQVYQAMKIIGENAMGNLPSNLFSRSEINEARKFNQLFYKAASDRINELNLSTLGTEARIELRRLEVKYSDISRLLTSIMEENHFNGQVRQFTDTMLSNFDSESNVLEESEVIYAINSIEDSVIKSSNIYREGIPVLVSALTGANEHIHPYFRSMLTDELGDYSSSAMEDITFKYSMSFNPKYHDFLDADKESVGEALSLVANAFTYMTQEPVEYRKELSSIYASEDNYILPDHRCLRTERFYMLWDIKYNQSIEKYLLALFTADITQFKIEYLCWKLSEKISNNKTLHNSYAKSNIDPFQMILDLENLIHLSCLAFNEGNIEQKQHSNLTVTE